MRSRDRLLFRDWLLFDTSERRKNDMLDPSDQSVLPIAKGFVAGLTDHQGEADPHSVLTLGLRSDQPAAKETCTTLYPMGVSQ